MKSPRAFVVWLLEPGERLLTATAHAEQPPWTQALGRVPTTPQAQEAWRGLISVIGDGGAVSVHAAGLGIPTAIAAFDENEAPPGSAAQAFGEHAARFDPEGDLVDQVAQLCATRLPGLGNGSVDPEALHELELASRCEPTLVWRCEVDLGEGDAATTWRRYPTTVAPRRGPGHLVATVLCRDREARENADVIVRHHDPLSTDHARDEAVLLLQEHPFAKLVSVRSGEGEAVLAGLEFLTRADRSEHLDAAVSVWLAAGRPAAGRHAGRSTRR